MRIFVFEFYIGIIQIPTFSDYGFLTSNSRYLMVKINGS
ncbi:hypothetical protein LEP1GSC198_2769 [Leptospira kirschneri str. JB]|nr:hypothetical protein LEP1GSC198_2769 [Leptospira kirschneri str. JB]